MFKHPVSICIALVLLLTGGWALYRAIGVKQPVAYSDGLLGEQEPSILPTLELTQPSADEAQTSVSRARPIQGDAWAKAIEQEIGMLLESRQYRASIEKIDSLYSQASSDDIERFKSLALGKAQRLFTDGNPNSAINLLNEYTKTFDDLLAWQILGSISSQTGDWNIAVTALLKSSAQEFETDAFNQSIRALAKAAHHLRKVMQQDGDQFGVLSLYQRLYEQHPSNPQFQLELAQAHLQLNDLASARPFLESLQYDSDLGAIAKQKLATLDAQRLAADNSKQPVAVKKPNRHEIVVPLLRAGSSLLVDVQLNRRSLRMLLDTGASITALSVETIADLGLRATGRSIQLSTANGVRSARLYHANNLRMGKINLSNLVVAEIEFGNNSQIQGLLGTDALKTMDSQFSYLIDDQRNALIFRQR